MHRNSRQRADPAASSHHLICELGLMRLVIQEVTKITGIENRK
jgi:hypothetical protein